MPPKSEVVLRKEEELEQYRQHKDDIKEAAKDAVTLISDAAAKAAEVVAQAASVSVKVLHEKNQDDHDLLIRLNTLMEILDKSVRELGTGMTTNMANLEHTKVGVKDFTALKTLVETDVEPRVRKIEINQNRYITTTILLMSAIGGAFLLLFMHITK